jgi:glycosyltransferase involved in cell wall biosynthesis
MEMDIKINKKPSKYNILFQGWVNIPHSYAIVNCFILVHLLKHHKDTVQVYIDEPSYFQTKWDNCKKLMYTEEYNDLIKSVPKWTGQRIDLVYRMTYPYNINKLESNPFTPICVFYTSEFSYLDINYFNLNLPVKIMDDHIISSYLSVNKQLFFTAPSEWSANGMRKYINASEEPNRNKIVTHGVDSSIFYKKQDNRKRIRELYQIEDDCIVIVCIGSMTQNKGIMEILVTLKLLVFNGNFRKVKLLMKGSADLYDSKNFLELYMTDLIKKDIIKKEESDILLKDHIIFTENTISFERLNDLYNASDVMISPYSAEGFNLTVLEAIAAGLPVLVSEHGSTEQFINSIRQNVPGAEKFIKLIPCKVEEDPTNRKRNVINCIDIANLFLKNKDTFYTGTSQEYNSHLQEYLKDNLSWKFVAGELVRYWTEILSSDQM